MMNSSEQDRQIDAKDLTVCDIIGDWGSYQWRLTCLALLSSAILSTTVVVGPIWTPNVEFACLSGSSGSSLKAAGYSTSLQVNYENNNSPTLTKEDLLKLAGSSNYDQLGECFMQSPGSNNGTDATHLLECTQFVYQDQDIGELLTNKFNLVCSRQWMRSIVTSSALIGFLLSSLTLGLLSDKFGRIVCIRVSNTLGVLATLGAILSDDYATFIICLSLMSFSQVAVSNAFCTLVMESTSPKWRFTPILNYGIGWSLGGLLAPAINELTHSYRYYLVVSLVAQLCLAILVRFFAHESIRWLLSEGRIDQAQDELKRACRINGIREDDQVADNVDKLRILQARKASWLIEHINNDPANQTDQSGISIRKTLAEALNKDPFNEPEAEPNRLQVKRSNSSVSSGSITSAQLSPTLARHNFSVTRDLNSSQTLHDPQPHPAENQSLAQLALKYSKTLQEQDEGTCFITMLFHRRLRMLTFGLSLLIIVVETSYFGLLSASGFVGTSVYLNYVMGSVGEALANLIYILLMWALSRRLALILPTMTFSTCLALMCLTYYLAPESPETASDSLELRNSVNFWLMSVGKLSLMIDNLISTTVAMESYPNNLRQTGPGAVFFCGRLSSVFASFLFNRHHQLRFEISLGTLAILGYLVCLLVPLFVSKDAKYRDLYDRAAEMDKVAPERARVTRYHHIGVDNK